MEKLANLIFELMWWNSEYRYIRYWTSNRSSDTWFYIHSEALNGDVLDVIPPYKLISHSYWFIKELVEKDKIKDDFFKYTTWIWERVDWEFVPRLDLTRYEKVLMALSIQKDPIWYLISLLK